MPRLEHDFLGEMRIPSDTYYGIQTYRAVENFPISGVSIASFPELIKALGLVKKASAIANMDDARKKVVAARSGTPFARLATRSLRASCTISSPWTAFRAVRELRPT